MVMGVAIVTFAAETMIVVFVCAVAVRRPPTWDDIWPLMAGIPFGVAALAVALAKTTEWSTPSPEAKAVPDEAQAAQDLAESAGDGADKLLESTVLGHADRPQRS
jgi:hypothetical protein